MRSHIKSPTKNIRTFYRIKTFSKAIWAFMPRKSFGFCIQKGDELVGQYDKIHFFLDCDERPIKITKEKAKKILGSKYFKLIPRDKRRFEDDETDKAYIW